MNGTVKKDAKFPVLNSNTRTVGGVAGKTVVRILIAIFVLIQVYPILWLVLSSFKTTAEFVGGSMFALPQGLHFENYVFAWTVGNIGILFRNTVIVTAIALFIVLMFSMPLAFAISRMRWKLSAPAFLIIRLGMFIPIFVLLLPQFLMFRDMGVLNTRWALIIAFSALNIPLATFLLVGFYKYIPNEIFESSVIDGCNIYRCFFHMAVPLTGSGYVTVLLLTFFTIWNNLLIPQTFVSSTAQRMLQSGLIVFFDAQAGRDWGPTFAGISIAVVPTIIVYLFLSKYVITGMTEGSVKG